MDANLERDRDELLDDRDDLLDELENFDRSAPDAAVRIADLGERVADLDARAKAQRVDRARALVRRLQSGELRTEGGSVGGRFIGEARGALSPLFPSAANLDRLEEARRSMSSLSLTEERAALKTTDMGTAVEYGPGGLMAPRSLWRASGIPTTIPPTGYAAVVPQFTLPSGASLVSEGNAHAEFDDVAPDAVNIRRTGSWSDLTSESMLSTRLDEIAGVHARIIARDLDLAAVAKIEDTPGDLTIDEALVTVASECAVDTSALWIVGTPGDVAALVGVASAMTPTNATDLASYATRYAGAALYVTPAATDGVLTIFHPGSFRAFATPLVSAVVVDPTTGAQRFGSWQFFGLGQSLVGSAVSVGEGS